MAKVVGLGVATWDMSIYVDRFPEENTKSSVNGIRTCGGGNCANTLVALSRLGIDTEILTVVGNDDYGHRIVESLKDERVSTDHVSTIGPVSPVSNIIVAKTGTRTILHQRGPSYDAVFGMPTNILEGVNLVYLDSRFYPNAKELAKLAYCSGIAVYVEAETARHHPEELFPYAEGVITSEDYAKEYSGSLEDILKAGPKMVVSTFGGNGSILVSERDTIRQESYKVDVLDTTGAGDAFIGGLIFGRVTGMDYAGSMAIAAYIAAKKCEKMGTRAGLPYLKDIPDDLLGK